MATTDTDLVRQLNEKLEQLSEGMEEVRRLARQLGEQPADDKEKNR